VSRATARACAVASPSHRIFADNIKRGEIAVFASSAPEKLGLPGLGTISEFAAYHHLTVAHIGMGCFSIRDGEVVEVLSFFGGGSMLERDGVVYTPLRAEGRRGAEMVALFSEWIAEFVGVSDCLALVAHEQEAAQHTEDAEFLDGRW